MIRIIARVVNGWPRLTLAGVLVLTFPGVRWGWGKWEEYRIERVMEEQNERGYLSKYVSLGIKFVDDPHPMRRAMTISDAAKGMAVRQEKIAIGEWVAGLGKWEESIEVAFSEVERFRNSGEAKANDELPSMKRTACRSGLIKYGGNYPELMRDDLRSALHHWFNEKTGKSIDRLEAALWLGEFMGGEMGEELELNPMRSLTLSGYSGMNSFPELFSEIDARVLLCGALNLISPKWGKLEGMEREKANRLINGLLNNERIIRNLRWAAPRYLEDIAIRDVRVAVAVNDVDIAKFEDELVLLKPAMKRERFERRKAVLDFQNRLADEQDGDESDLGVMLCKGEFPFCERKCSLAKTLGKYRDSETYFRMTAIHLACELYRGDHGKYPSSLEVLSPDYLPVIPKPLRRWTWSYTCGETNEVHPKLTVDHPKGEYFPFGQIEMENVLDRKLWMGGFNEETWR